MPILKESPYKLNITKQRHSNYLDLTQSQHGVGIPNILRGEPMYCVASYMYQQLLKLPTSNNNSINFMSDPIVCSKTFTTTSKITTWSCYEFMPCTKI